MSKNEPALSSSPRFLTIPDVADELATSTSQIYALLRSGDLKGIQIGGRGQWRIERVKLEEFLSQESACDAVISGDGGDGWWTTLRHSLSNWWSWAEAVTRSVRTSSGWGISVGG